MGLSLGGLINSVTEGVSDFFSGDFSGVVDDVKTGVSSLGFSSDTLGIGSDSGDQGGATVYRDTGEIVSGGVSPSYGTEAATTNGSVMQTSLVTAIPTLVMSAIVKLSQKFGGAGRNPLTYGKRIWDSLYAFATKNPGVSLIATLTGIGLTIEEAAHFLAWGAVKKKRRRRRGITAANLKTTRRTLRTIVKMYHSLPHTSGPRRVFGGSRTSIVKA